jgi:hypothetical protein
MLKKLLISTEWVSLSFRQKTYDMSNLELSYNKILDLLHELETQDNFLGQRRLPKLTDKQLIALSLAAESLGMDSERHLFRQLPTALLGQIDRSVFNRRRRQLAPSPPGYGKAWRQAWRRPKAITLSTACRWKSANSAAPNASAFARTPPKQHPTTAIARHTRRIISAISSMPCARPKGLSKPSAFQRHPLP